MRDSSKENKPVVQSDKLNPLVKVSSTRRSLLAVLGIASVAGCSDLVTDESTDDSEAPTNDEDAPTESVITPAEIISQHSEQLQSVSYTFSVNYQGEESAPENQQQVEYKYDNNKNVAALDKETTNEDGVDRLSQLYSENDVVANVVFEDRDSITLTLREGKSKHEQLTGESIFDYYLPGAIFDESHEEEQTEDDSIVTVYELVSHRSYDSLDGILKVDDQGFIQLFRFEWLDSQDEEHWIEYDLSNVGQSTIDIGPEFEADT